MYENLPVLPTSVIGSYAVPGWLHTAREAALRGEYGAADMRETLDDAVDMALRDQEDAGVDLVSDGEMRRVGFFTAEFYRHMTGLRELPAQRKVGSFGHDQRESYEAVASVEAPQGLGLLAEYEYVRTRTTRPVKMPCPGPYTLAGRIQPGGIYKDRIDVAYALAGIINAELKTLVAAGCTIIQLDEPSYAVHAFKGGVDEYIRLFNTALDGVDAHIALHLCFGNFVGRPVAKRTYQPLFASLFNMHAHEFSLEFANREMAEIELLAQVPSDRYIAAGLVDVKNYYVETAEDVAERIRTALRYIPAERLVITPDCGFSQTARWAARAKLKAMTAGAQIVRRELTGG